MPAFTLILLGEASAYPHGSGKAQEVRSGEVVLMDCGCTVEGYQSDISRTFVMGEATKQQRDVWNLVRRGQQIAFETAKVGTPAGAVDDAVRAAYEKAGFGPGYKLPGTSHRTGHVVGGDRDDACGERRQCRRLSRDGETDRARHDAARHRQELLRRDGEARRHAGIYADSAR